MSISKDERERLQDKCNREHSWDRAVKLTPQQVSDMLDALDDADERITTLENEGMSVAGQLTEVELERDYLQHRVADLQRENDRLDYMLRYIDATSVDRRLTMKANEAWLKKEERGL